MYALMSKHKLLTAFDFNIESIFLESLCTDYLYFFYYSIKYDVIMETLSFGCLLVNDGLLRVPTHLKHSYRKENS